MPLHDHIANQLDELQQVQLRRRLPACPPGSGELDFSSNDYLGLSTHPEVIEAGVVAAQRFGAGATGSRLLSGNLDCFEALEAQVAAFKGSQAALVMNSGYQANSSALAALLDKALWGCVPQVFTDRLNHASLHHACQLAGVRQHRFRHNDLAHLAELLAQTDAANTPKIIVTETVFGMEGDTLPVVELAELALAHGALVYLDEAHATGVWGPQGRGLGATEHPAIEALKAMGHWVVMGTFSKAVGVAGAYLAVSQAVKDYLLNRCTGFVYSTAPSPFVTGAVSRALELIPGMDAQRALIARQADALRAHLAGCGLNSGLSNTHIVPVVVGEAQVSLHLKAHLEQLGLRSSAVRPPTVPPNTARVRLALSARHSPAALEALHNALRTWVRLAS